MLWYSITNDLVTLRTTTRLWLRAPLCVALAAALLVAVTAPTAPTEQQGLDSQRLSSIVALAPPAHSTTIQTNHAEQRAENARHRAPAPFPFLLPAHNTPGRGRGSLAVLDGSSRPQSVFTEDTQSGRSPPLDLLIG